MQIEFEKIRWQNLLSTGNAWTEIDLNAAPTTLVVGVNGAGKSTLLDALFFALFGRPFRKINKGQLVNSITGKELMVELEFRRGGKSYKIRRGIKPNVFEIFQDGELLDQPSARDYQELLEKSVLGFNHKSGSQIIVLGSANYTPFMQLAAGDRRQVIEDLLDIQVFSVMNTLLKVRITQNREAIDDVDRDVRHVRQKLELIDKHLEDLKINNTEVIERHQDRMKKLAAEAMEWFEEIEALEASLEEIEAVPVPDDKELVGQRRKIEAARAKVVAESNIVSKEKAFLENNDNCPTCKQVIDATFKTTHAKEAMLMLSAAESAVQEMDETIKWINAKLDNVNAVRRARDERVSEVVGKINGLKHRCDGNRRMIQDLESEVHKLQRRVTHHDVEGGPKIREELNFLLNTRSELVRNQKLLSLASALLKDGGIKARIIRQYVPVMNQLINKFLAQMDFFIDFNLDEEFNEKIMSRNRDDFTYEMFSEGEKMRIDLSLLFAWRSIAKMRASASTNLLIFDEIMDSSLDGHGAEEFMKMLNSLTDGTRTFMISHRGDQLMDKFKSVIRFEKKQNFSRIAA